MFCFFVWLSICFFYVCLRVWLFICFLACFFSSFLLCFFASLLLCFFASLPLCFFASLLLCFFASLLLCFFASLLREVTHIPFPFRCDYLKITNEKNKTFEVYCGVKTGRHVIVTGKVAVLTFHSDYSFQRRGFLVFFTTIPIGKYMILTIPNSSVRWRLHRIQHTRRILRFAVFHCWTIF